MFGGQQGTSPGTRTEQGEKWWNVTRGEGAVARTGRLSWRVRSRGKGHADGEVALPESAVAALWETDCGGLRRSSPASRVFQGLCDQILVVYFKKIRKRFLCASGVEKPRSTFQGKEFD